MARLGLGEGSPAWWGAPSGRTVRVDVTAQRCEGAKRYRTCTGKPFT